MKRYVLLASALLLLSSFTLQAQEETYGILVEKVNPKKLSEAIAKSNAEITDAKKNAKASTWFKRGNVFYDAAIKPTNGLYVGLDEATLLATFGKDITPTPVEIDGQTFSEYTFEHFKAYVKDKKVASFVPVTVIDPNAYDKAYEAYAKAYSLDPSPKMQKKVRTGILDLISSSKQQAGNYFTLHKYPEAAYLFRRAYEMGLNETVGVVDTLSIYYAGYISTIAGKFKDGADYLQVALKLGLEDNGDTYYYLFHAYYNLEEYEKGLELLKEAITKYPNNNNIIEGLLTLYSTMDGKDPNEIIPMVEHAIELDPKNPSLYFGLGRVYDKLGQTDKAIESMQKSVDLSPDDFYSNFNLAFFIMKKGDEMNNELNGHYYTSQEEYNKDLAKVSAVYASAIPILEKAHQANPDDLTTVELLKNVTFRLRDDGMGEKYEQYNALYNSMKK